MKRLTTITLGLFLIWNGMPSCAQPQYFNKTDSLKLALASSDNDSINGLTLHRLVQAYSQLNKLDSMYMYMDQLEEVANRTNDQRIVISLYYQRAAAYFSRSLKYDTAVIIGKRGLELLIASELDLDAAYESFNNLIGLVYKNMEEYDSALFYYENLYEWAKSKDRLMARWQARYNTSRLYGTVNNRNRALEYAFLCLDEAKLHFEKYQDEGILTASNRLIGEAYFGLGSFKKAIDYYDIAIESFSKQGEAFKPEVNYLYQKKGAALMQLNANDEGLEFYYKNKNYLIGVYGENHVKLIPSYLSIGRAAYLKKDYDQARRMFEKALEIKAAVSEQPDQMTLVNLARLERDLGNTDLAIQYLEQAVKLAQSDQLSAYNELGITYQQQGDFMASLDAFRSALRYEEENKKTGFSVEELSDNWLNVIILQKIGELYEDQYIRENQGEYLEKALEVYQIGDQLSVELRSSFKQQKSEIDFVELFNNLYRGGVRVSDQLYGLTQQEQYLESSFYFSEQMKAMVLSRFIFEQEQITFSELPDSLSNLEQDLKSKIEFYQSKLSRRSSIKDSVKVTQYELALFNANRDLNSLLLNFEKVYPEYYSLKHGKSHLPVTQVQDLLSSNQTLIEFVFVDELLHAFVIDNDKAITRKLRLPTALDSLIVTFKKTILEQEISESEETGRVLYEILFEPIQEHIQTTEVIIVPDGILWHVNFDLLVNKDSENELPFLIGDYAISYANSANLLFQKSVTTSPKVKGCLAFSYIDSVEVETDKPVDFLVLRDADTDLPGTRKEITSIANLIPGTYYFGSEASERNFKEKGPDYSILHLAVHGELDDTDPGNSRLNFSKNASDSLNDNYLYAFELYNMRLNADMAVLSACNTGSGKLANGEGVMSLGRAFQYAGVKSLLISNWEVLDDVAPEIIESFYKNLKEGQSKSEALRQAKLSYLSTATIYRQAPYNWASFNIVGDPSPIDMEERNLLIWILFGAVGVVSIVIGMNRKARKSKTA